MVTTSPAAARKLRRRLRTHCMSDLVADVSLDGPLADEVGRIEAVYDTPTLRDVYRTDWPCHGRSEAWCLDRTVRHFRAMEGVFDRESPNAVFLDVGGETLRTVAHLVAKRRGVTSLFPFYTIFPQPLRLYADSMHAPIVTADEILPLSNGDRAAVEPLIADFTSRAEPIRKHRRTPTLRTHWRNLFRHASMKLTIDRRNEYLRPDLWIRGFAVEALRRRAARFLYSDGPSERPYVYSPCTCPTTTRSRASSRSGPTRPRSSRRSLTPSPPGTTSSSRSTRWRSAGPS